MLFEENGFTWVVGPCIECHAYVKGDALVVVVEKA